MIAGDLRSAKVAHPELGDKTFEGKSGEDFNYDPGGFKVSDEEGDIGTNGTPIYKKNRARWMAEMTLLNNDGDTAFLKQLQENPLDGDWTFEHVSGDVFVAKGRPVGDVAPNLQAGTIGIKCAGGGRLEQL